MEAVTCAHVEAICAHNGIGLVKLMGRESGFIACYATLASQQVNFCLVPEVSFALEGSAGFLEALSRRILLRKHAVVSCGCRRSRPELSDNRFIRYGRVREQAIG